MSRGFTLAEVVVAMTLLSVGMLAVAATAVMAAHTRARGALVERMAVRANSVLDSIAALHISGSGESSDGRITLVWSSSADEVVVRVTAAGEAPIELRARP